MCLFPHSTVLYLSLSLMALLGSFSIHVNPLCANNANVIQASRCLAHSRAKTWVFAGQMDAAPGLPSPLTPLTDVPYSPRAPARSAGKSLMRRNQRVNTREQLGASELRGGARCCVETDVDESRERRPAEALWDACVTSASGLNGTQALIHKLRG